MRPSSEHLVPFIPSVALAIAISACGASGASVATPLPGRPPDTAPRLIEKALESPHLLLGLPQDGDPTDDVLLDHGVYVASYHPARRVPNWVAWRLERADLGNAPRRNRFRVDPHLPFGLYRATPEDYARSGYDRGHLCPSADRTRGPDENALTFFMTNIHPQLHELNAGPWAQLEAHARDLAQRSDVELYIVAGGIFAEPALTIGRGVAVPAASYKIVGVLARGQTPEEVTVQTPVFAVRMPNAPGVGGRAWTEFVVSVDALERESRYDFMRRIPQPLQEQLESRVGVRPGMAAAPSDARGQGAAERWATVTHAGR